ncbi:MAG: radical SAM protein [bacterium]
MINLNKKIDYSWLFDKVRDTYSLFSYYFGDGKSLPPIRYSLELTYKCNLNCSYCYVGENRNFNELSVKEWFDIIDQIPPFALITLVGGEPLIRKDFKTILKKSLKKNKINIVTNGTLIDDELIEIFIAKKLLLLSVSIDGFGEKHDLNRGKQGAFDKTVKNLERLRDMKKNKKYPLLDIKTIILENNLDDLVEIYKLADDLKADFLSLAFLRANNLKQNNILREEFTEEFYKTLYPVKLYFDMEHFEEVYRQIKELSKKSKTKIRFAPKFNPNDELAQIKRFFSLEEGKIQDIYEPCLYPWSNIIITPEGNIYPCLSYNIGNIKNSKIKDVLNNEKFKNFRKQLKTNKMFSSCQMCCELKVKI